MLGGRPGLRASPWSRCRCRESPSPQQQILHGIGPHPRQVHQYVRVLKVMIRNKVSVRILRDQLPAILHTHPYHQRADIIPQPRQHRAPHLERRSSVRGGLLDVLQSQRHLPNCLKRHRTPILALTTAPPFNSHAPAKLSPWSEKSSGSPSCSSASLPIISFPSGGRSAPPFPSASYPGGWSIESNGFRTVGLKRALIKV